MATVGGRLRRIGADRRTDDRAAAEHGDEHERVRTELGGRPGQDPGHHHYDTSRGYEYRYSTVGYTPGGYIATVSSDTLRWYRSPHGRDTTRVHDAEGRLPQAPAPDRG